MYCNKKRFKDKKQAIRALHLIANKEDKRDHKPVRAYKCKGCKGYHLSSILIWYPHLAKDKNGTDK